MRTVRHPRNGAGGADASDPPRQIDVHALAVGRHAPNSLQDVPPYDSGAREWLGNRGTGRGSWRRAINLSGDEKILPTIPNTSLATIKSIRLKQKVDPDKE
jgi:hypothetical protein